MNCPDCGRPCDGTKGLLIHRRKLHGPGRLAAFMAHVVVSDSCWTWTGQTSNGYGRTTYGDRSEAAHRVSWRLHRGDIPDGSMVLHRCDNPPCVNPNHLYLGDHAQNMRDRSERGRVAHNHNPIYGERNGRHASRRAAAAA